MTVTVGNNTKEHFITLEWFRFILSLYIVIFHTFNYQNAPAWIREVFETGFFATSSFFILSGFILAHVYLKNKGTPNVALREKPKDFLIKRFANLYPIHIISMFIFFVVIFIIPYIGTNTNDSAATIRFVIYDATNGAPYEELKHYMSNTELVIAFVMNIFMIQSWNPYYMAFNFPTWSISTLFFFYMTFPFIAVRIHRLKRPYLFLLILNALALVPVCYLLINTDMGYPEAGFLHRNPLIRLPEFIGGVLLCYIYHKNKAAGLLPNKNGMIRLFIYIVVYFAVMRTFLYYMMHVWDSWYIAYHLLHNGAIMTLEMMILYFVVNLPHTHNQKVIAFIERLASSSLPMFALHIPIYSLFSRIHKILSGDPMLCLTDFNACVAASGTPDYQYYILYLIITVYLCIIFQEKVVIPIRKKIIQKSISV